MSRSLGTIGCLRVETIEAPVATKLVQGRSESEIAALFDRHGKMVLRRARTILGDEDAAQDVAQEVFVRAFLEGETFEGRSQISTWLYRITTNLSLNLLRDESRRRELLEQHYAGAERSAAPELDRALTVRRLLAAAGEEEAKAAIYVYIDGMSHRETAEMLGVSKRTVGNLLERFQRTVDTQLGEGAKP